MLNRRCNLTLPAAGNRHFEEIYEAAAATKADISLALQRACAVASLSLALRRSPKLKKTDSEIIRRHAKFNRRLKSIPIIVELIGVR